MLYEHFIIELNKQCYTLLIYAILIERYLFKQFQLFTKTLIFYTYYIRK